MVFYLDDTILAMKDYAMPKVIASSVSRAWSRITFCTISFLQGVVAPVLQGLVAFAVYVLLCFFFLCQMSLEEGNRVSQTI